MEKTTQLSKRVAAIRDAQQRNAYVWDRLPSLEARKSKVASDEALGQRGDNSEFLLSFTHAPVKTL